MQRMSIALPCGVRVSQRPQAVACACLFRSNRLPDRTSADARFFCACETGVL